MESIPIIRAALLFPYLEFLRKVGAPVDRGLRQANLPANLGHQPEAKLPLLRTLAFLTNMSHSEGIDNLVFRATEYPTINQLNPILLNSILSAPTLKVALETLFRLATNEDSHINFWMATEGSSVRICSREGIPFDRENTRHGEMDTNMMLVAIIQAFAGPQWYPAEMAFRSNLPFGQYVFEKFPNTHFKVYQKMAWVNVTQTILSLPPSIKSNLDGSPSTLTPAIETERAFPASLKAVLQSYFNDGYPDIQLAAEISGTSVRTLQRHLKQFNLTYSNLIHQAQFESAVELLKNSNINIIDVAYSVGYKDPSNFARAFRRIAGIGPNEYRNNQLFR